MRNLKKILALVLALVMSMSLVSIASADFSDAADIEHKEAVDVLVSLGVIDGVGNNLYNPTGTVTRAQMAKMITIITLGDVDVTAFKGTVTDLTDIGGHWAEAYIKYCYSQGIIAGKGNGVFAPNAPVTAVEAAKMLLVAIGYNANVQGYVANTQWAINVTRDAQLSSFYEDLSVASDKVLTRDEAAQMIWNAVQATMIEKTTTYDRETGRVSDHYAPYDNGLDLLRDTFGVQEFKGILTDAVYDVDDANIDYEVYGTIGNTTDNFTFTHTNDYSALYQQTVTVLYKVNKDSTITTYGIYGDKNAVVAEGIVGDLALVSTDASKMKLGTKTYKVETNVAGVNMVSFLTADANDNGVADTVLSTLQNITDAGDGTDNGNGYREDGKGTITTAIDDKAWGYEVALIDQNKNGKVDVIVVYPFVVDQVDYVGTKTFTTDNGTSRNFKDVVTYEGLAKNDWVKITAAANTVDNKEVFEKLELVAATTEAVKLADGRAQFSGTWLKTVITDPTLVAEAGAKVEYVAINGYLYHLAGETNKTALNKFVVVTKVETVASGAFNTYETQILHTDGTKELVRVAKVNNSAVVTDPLNTPNLVEGALYTYKVNSDGNVELTSANATNITSSNTALNKVMAQNSGLIDTNNAMSTMDFVVVANGVNYFDKNGGSNQGDYYIADDAIIFLKNGTKYSVITGAALKATSTDTSKNMFVGANTNKTTGFNNVVIAYVEVGTDLTNNNTLYGYVVDDVVKYKDGSNYYVTVTFWDGTKNVTLNTKSGASDGALNAAAYALSKRDMFKYTVDANGKIDSIQEFTKATMTDGATGSTTIETGAVVAYADNLIEIGSKYFTSVAGTNGAVTNTNITETLKITKDTQIFYVDSDAIAGAEGGTIRLAFDDTIGNNADVNFANVWFIANGNDEAQLIVVDIDNDINRLV